ncbi:uncharacterized protein EV420DRAFT_1689531 [Desarmillaria tabescens]|uniref:Uncharacterized protein n=1 Tax=Armillaria tabescens TaxID=1929756 RepID=A0AA39J149_ARMTA|nr:uncharacterized protein EV420DRAFT_1689531 [Desarmillaria tabescens]KAK0433589.1 hypothetical protein EV420DRAFT_1689531 [Desarmillaria tabescens]
MHLIWENLMKNLVLLWTREFKGLDEGMGCYVLDKSVWEAIGKATAASGSTIPSAYGPRVPNMSTDHSNMSAEMWSFWSLYLRPVLLQRCFKDAKYFKHFVHLVMLLNLCLQFEISTAEIQQTEHVSDRLYYQYDPARISTCPVTIHALLHIADSIETMGPVWCYWAFPMEWYCGKLQPSIQSHRFPYHSLDHFILESAQLTQLQILYKLHDELALRPSHRGKILGSFQSESCKLSIDPTCMLLPPRSPICPDEKLLSTSVSPALKTRFMRVDLKVIRKHLKAAFVEEWGTVRHIDSEEGDTMHASSMYKHGEDHRDPTFVRYQMYVDKFANQRRHAEELELKTFYGRLERIIYIHFRASAHQDLHIQNDADAHIILAVIRNTVVDESLRELLKLDIHFSSHEGKLDVIDITSVQCLIGRVFDGDHCALIDHSGSLACAIHVDDSDIIGDE